MDLKKKIPPAKNGRETTYVTAWTSLKLEKKVENLLVYDSLVSQVLKLAADLTRMIIM